MRYTDQHPWPNDLSISISQWVIIDNIFEFNPFFNGILGEVNRGKIGRIVKNQRLWSPKPNDDVTFKK